MKVLIVEDEWRLADTIKSRLERERFVVETSGDGLDGLDLARFGQFDVIILDLMLPSMDGSEILDELKRSEVASKVIILTAKSTLRDKLEGFDCGADDYLTKPFQMEELVARVKRLGRSNITNAESRLGNIYLNHTKMQLENTENGETIEIMGKELHLLELFFENPEIVFDKQRIFDKILGMESESTLNSVEVYISF
ncbi:MAG: response regulator transcription factor, partial [Candidatus Saccharibacteria bacterium]|nr:response regulator transcription factor [Candidatus Saccharibacteria bacterium]